MVQVSGAVVQSEGVIADEVEPVDGIVQRTSQRLLCGLFECAGDLVVVFRSCDIALGNRRLVVHATQLFQCVGGVRCFRRCSGQRLPHRTEIERIQLAVCAEVTRLPVRQHRVRHCQQLFLEQHHVSDGKFAVGVEVAGCCGVCFRSERRGLGEGSRGQEQRTEQCNSFFHKSINSNCRESA